MKPEISTYRIYFIKRSKASRKIFKMKKKIVSSPNSTFNSLEKTLYMPIVYIY